MQNQSDKAFATIRWPIVVSGIWLAGLAGCDKGTDPAVDRATAAAAASLAAGDAGKAVSDLGSQLSAAGRPGGALAGKTVLAAAKLRLATEKNGDLNVVLGQISRLTGQMAEIAAIVSNGNVMAKGYESGDPKAVLAELAKRSEAATAGGTWVQSEGVKFPAVSEARQASAKLQTDVAAAQEHLKGLESQHAEAIKEVDDLTSKAASMTGHAQVDGYALAAAARKKASDVSSDIDGAKAGITRLTQDLGLANTQQKSAEIAVTDLKNLSQGVSTGFQEVQKMVELQRAVAKSAIDMPTPAGAPAAKAADGAEVKVVTWVEPAGLKDKAKRLAELSEQAKTLRGEAEALYTESAVQFSAAAAEANELRKYATEHTIGGEFDKAVFEKLQEAIKPALNNVQEAHARLELAHMRTAYAVTLRDRQAVGEQLAATLKEAGASLDGLTDASLDAEVKQAAEGAVTEYNSAISLMENAADGGFTASDKRRFSAKAGAAVAHYGLALHARLLGDAAAAKSEMDKALDWRKKIIEDGAAPGDVPSLPSELAIEAPKPIAPAAKPAEAATEPAPDAAAAPAAPATPEAPK